MKHCYQPQLAFTDIQIVSQAMTLSGILVLALVIYTGFVLPTPYMHPWFDWIHYISKCYRDFRSLYSALTIRQIRFTTLSKYLSRTNFTDVTLPVLHLSPPVLAMQWRVTRSRVPQQDRCKDNEQLVATHTLQQATSTITRMFGVTLEF